jgi:transposase
MEGYPIAAVERAMKVQEVILRARAKKITWIAAAEILGITPRSLRRWQSTMKRYGADHLMDRRRRVPSQRRVPGPTIDRILALYRERYAGYNVRHFHDTVKAEHGIEQSYTFVKQVLQGAGLVRKQRARGKHRQRRERRACFGEMLHLDGSRHHWLALAPEAWQCLIAVVDDATGRLLYAQLWPGESRVAVMAALHTVFLEHGLPQQLYTDRAGWAAYTPRAGGKPDPGKPTQVERALAELGVAHVRAYSPQARGRSERVNRTLQGRLVNELRSHGIATLESANRYLRDHSLADYNGRFSKAAADPASGLVAVSAADLDRCLCLRGERVVNRDNTVVLGKTVLQIPPQSGRRSCQGLRVVVRQHLDGGFTVHAGLRFLASYDSRGRLHALDSGVASPRDRPSTGLLRSRNSRRHPKARKTGAIRAGTRSTAKRTDHLSKPSGQITC